MAKSRKKRKSNQKNNSLWIFIAIIIVIAIISMIISYFWVENDKPDVFLLPSDTKTETVKTDKPESEVTASPIDGTWVSNYDGAMLTVAGQSFTLEISGVDGAGKTTGSFAIEGNICTFVYESGNEACKGNEGHYLYSIDDSGELYFELIKDICESRKERMTATWFSL
jgi:hypothetical protein